MKQGRDISWTLYSWTLISIVVIFQVLRWQLFPAFMDIYYHLSVMLGFDRAGGYVTTDFLQYAPVGRPHLYPPLLHFIMLGFYKLGFSPLVIARLLNVVLYPLMLISLWVFGRTVFGRRFAFWSVVLGSSSYYFYLEISNLPAFSLAFITGVLALAALERDRSIAAVLLLAMTFYSHTFVGYLILTSVFLYGIFVRKAVRYGSVTAAVIVLSLPILVHQTANYRYFRFSDAAVLHDAAINIFLYLLALAGLAACAIKKQKYYLLLSLFSVFLSMAAGNYQSRFFSGAAQVPLIFLGAAGIELLLERMGRYGKNVSLSVVLLVFTAVYIFSPAIFFSRKTPASAKGVYSVFMNLFLPGSGLGRMPLERGLDSCMYNPKFTDPLIKLIRENSSPDDILYSDASYAAGMLSVFSGRAISCGMLPEVMPYQSFDQIKSAKLIVWFKETDGTYSEKLGRIINTYALAKIAENDIAAVYKNPFGGAKIIVPRPLIPETGVFTILFVLILIILAGILFW
jgi:hypothetical protein